jgi:uncharacterized membrane protein
MPPSPSNRIAYVDWLRGLACVVMFQTHCYDAWLGDSARKGKWFAWSRIGGTLPAPLFLFLAGISVALVAERLQKKGVSSRKIAFTVLRRGAEILGLGLLFRVQEFVIAWGWAPWSDLLRVDILNTIGAAILLLGALLLVFSGKERVLPKARTMVAALGVAAAISLATPLLWTAWRPDWLPWPIETYINGVHNTGKPVLGLFPIFPWGGFAFVGFAAGLVILSRKTPGQQASFFACCAAVGGALMYSSQWLVARPWHLYPVFDYWHTSPEFFLARSGLLLIVLALGYAWCRWGAGAWSHSPISQLGKTSLLVYWVHIELVYGRFSILPRRKENIVGATMGFFAICLSMLLLSIVRTKWKSYRIEVRRAVGNPAGAA